MQNLIEINTENFDVVLDLRYATENNVCQRRLYSYPFCYLHKEAAEALQKAIEAASNIGLKIKIFDSFRPIEVQQYMFDQFPGGFVSNPKNGRIPHCRGVAVDLTLVDESGAELDMGTDFDEFSDLAHHNCSKVSVEAQRNRLILLGLMKLAGFDHLSFEWWHYQLPNPTSYEVVAAKDGMVGV
ncbi:MAG: D-alanyl-D-alanine dipeptidase [Pelagibacterales bacterium]|nr:D-alanyl-D-alanine dipeptidase [Pelagibacterales bacterium]